MESGKPPPETETKTAESTDPMREGTPFTQAPEGSVPTILDPHTPIATAEDIERIEEAAVMHKRMILALVKLTHRWDWTPWPKNDLRDGRIKGYTWSLGHSGCERIMQALGIGIRNTRYIKKETEGGYMYEFWGEMYLRNRTLEVLGACSTNKAFHGRKDKQKIPLAEIAEDNIMKDAQSNMLSRGVKMFVGFGSIGDEIVTKWFKENEWDIDAVQFTKGAQGGNTSTADEKKLRQEISQGLTTYFQGDKEAAAKKLEELTGFQGKEDWVNGVTSTNNLKGKRLEIAHEKVLKFVKDDPPKNGK